MFDMLHRPEIALRKDIRPYQAEAINRLRSSFIAGRRRPVLALPTGGGKSLIAANIIRSALDRGKRCVFTVPQIILVDQTVAAFEAEGINDIGVIQGKHPRFDPYAPVQIASLQTLSRRFDRHGDWSADLVLVDECHIGFEYLRDWMGRSDARFIGLSATPWAKGMGLLWDDLIIGTDIGALIESGYLSRFTAYAPAHPDLSGVGVQAGDYAQGQLSEAMQAGALVADIVQTWKMRAHGRPTICFCVDRAHAAKVRDRFRDAGITAEMVDYRTEKPEREDIARRFEAGDVKVVCNCRTLTTGVDWAVSCIIDAAPTRSAMLHVQKIGRGLRVNPGTEDCLILDHADNSTRLGLVTDIGRDRLCTKAKGERAEPEAKAPLPKECGKCQFLKPPKTHVCPMCGFAPEVTSQIEEEAGQLVQIKSKAGKGDKQAWYSMLLHVAAVRGRSDGWVAHTYRERFGVWPRGLSYENREPTPEVLNYVRAKDIRHAKRRAA